MLWHGQSEVLTSREAWVTIDDRAERRPKCEDVVFSSIRSEARSHQLKALTMDDFTMHCSWDFCWKLYFKGNAINTKLAVRAASFHHSVPVSFSFETALSRKKTISRLNISKVIYYFYILLRVNNTIDLLIALSVASYFPERWTYT